MANYDQLFVYKSCYTLLLMLHRNLNKLPRDIKYTLLQDLKQDSLHSGAGTTEGMLMTSSSWKGARSICLN